MLPYNHVPWEKVYPPLHLWSLRGIICFFSLVVSRSENAPIHSLSVEFVVRVKKDVLCISGQWRKECLLTLVISGDELSPEAVI